MSKGSSNILFYITVFMSALYPIFGLYIIFSEDVARILPGNKHIILGIVLLAYGAFRFFRLKRIRNQIDIKQRNENIS
jgi:hypothetical protein